MYYITSSSINIQIYVYSRPYTQHTIDIEFEKHLPNPKKTNFNN